MSWKLHIGLHRGTKQSHESEIHTTKYDSPHEPLFTLEDAKECAKEWHTHYARLGYYIWFAHAVSSAGETISNLLPADPYR
ncbi:hypothetical protein IFO70_24450 [Phormidium tenue FACHB-886]|nr:hypothetical protein [Phormidium tenue FACHB-886]